MTAPNQTSITLHVAENGFAAQIATPLGKPRAAQEYALVVGRTPSELIETILIDVELRLRAQLCAQLSGAADE